MPVKPYIIAFAVALLPAFSQNPTSPQGTMSPQTTPQQPGTPGTPGGIPETFPGGGNTTPMTQFSDKDFVKHAVDQNVTEVELGKLAQEKGSSDEVKQFGKRMAEDGAKENSELAAAAAKVNVDVPSDLPRGGKKTVDKLSKLSGPDFDRAYAKLMLNSQRENLDAFTQEAQSGKIPEVRDYAAKQIPTLQALKKMAEELQASVKK
jgi:putative membrane protein